MRTPTLRSDATAASDILQTDDFATMTETSSPWARLDEFVAGAIRHWKPYRPQWNSEDGCIYKGCLDLAAASGERWLRDFVVREVTARVAGDGGIAGFDAEKFDLESINSGKVLGPLLELTDAARFRRALDVQFEQLERQPRTQSGNYWHKQSLPSQVWLDGLYMAQPFQVSYARIADRPELLEDSRQQFAHVRTALRDTNSGLYYHAWDEQKQERWANPQTGCSASVFARGVGWYFMALVDVLEAAGSDDAGAALREEVSSQLRDLATAVLAVRSPGGLWFQVLDQSGREGNYEETSASLMFAYGLMKGARLGVLPSTAVAAGSDALRKCLEQRLDAGGLQGICANAGLGGEPYRDGSCEYYISEQPMANDPKGVGALLMAISEAVKSRS